MILKYMAHGQIAVLALACSVTNRTLDANRYVKEGDPKSSHLELLAAVQNMLTSKPEHEEDMPPMFDESIQVLRRYHDEIKEEDKRCYYLRQLPKFAELIRDFIALPILACQMQREGYPAEPTEADVKNLEHFVLDYNTLYKDGMVELCHRHEFKTLDYVIIDEYPSSYYGQVDEETGLPCGLGTSVDENGHISEGSFAVRRKHLEGPDGGDEIYATSSTPYVYSCGVYVVAKFKTVHGQEYNVNFLKNQF